MDTRLPVCLSTSAKCRHLSYHLLGASKIALGDFELDAPSSCPLKESCLSPKGNRFVSWISLLQKESSTRGASAKPSDCSLAAFSLFTTRILLCQEPLPVWRSRECEAPGVQDGHTTPGVRPCAAQRDFPCTLCPLVFPWNRPATVFSCQRRCSGLELVVQCYSTNFSEWSSVEKYISLSKFLLKQKWRNIEIWVLKSFWWIQLYDYI